MPLCSRGPLSRGFPRGSVPKVQTCDLLPPSARVEAAPEAHEGTKRWLVELQMRGCFQGPQTHSPTPKLITIVMTWPGCHGRETYECVGLGQEATASLALEGTWNQVFGGMV